MALNPTLEGGLEALKKYFYYSGFYSAENRKKFDGSIDGRFVELGI